MIDTDIENAIELLKKLGERRCETPNLITPSGSCRDYWKADPTRWCLVCTALNWTEDFERDRSEDQVEKAPVNVS